MTRTTKLIAVAGAVVALVAGGFLWWFFSDDAPAEVSLDAAVQGVDPASPDAQEAVRADGVEGTWAVDAHSGSFDYDSATGTFVGFRIQEELARVGSTTAVGRTGDVSGTVTIAGTNVTAVDIDVDLTTITTNDDRRDDKVQDALDTGQFPSARFSLTEPIDLDPSAAEGVPTMAVAAGELTLHGVTQPVRFALEAQLVGETIVVVGSTEIVFADFDVRVPSAPIVLSVEDRGTLELQVLLVRE